MNRNFLSLTTVLYTRLCLLFVLPVPVRISLVDCQTTTRATPPSERPPRPTIPTPANYETLVIPSAGRTASLGSLYDHTREMFSPANIFEKRPDKSIVTTIDKPHIATAFGLSNTLTEKARLLSVSAEAALSLSFLDIKGTGMVDYLQETSSKSNSVKGSLVYSATTLVEALNPFFTKAAGYINKYILHQAAGTHIVVGIEYGAHLFIEFEDQNSNNSEKHEIAGQLEASISAASLNLTLAGNVSGSSKDKLIETFRKFDFTLRGDINLDDAYPTDFSQVIDLIVKFPKLVKLSEGGRGAQKNFYLMPKESLQRWLEIEDPVLPPKSSEEVPATANGREAEEEVLVRKRRKTPNNELKFPAQAMKALLFFEYVDIVQRSILDMSKKLHTFREFIDENSLNRSAHYLESVVRLRRVLSKKLNKAIIKLRNGTFSLDVFEQKWEKYLFLARKVLHRMEEQFSTEFERASFKVELVKAVAKLGIWTNRKENYLSTVVGSLVSHKKDEDGKFTCITRYKGDFTVLQMINVLKNVKKAVAEEYYPIVVDCDTNNYQGTTAPCSDTGAAFDESCVNFGAAVDSRIRVNKKGQSSKH